MCEGRVLWRCVSVTCFIWWVYVDHNYVTGGTWSVWWWRLLSVTGQNWYGREAGPVPAPLPHGSHPSDEGSTPGETT